MNNRTENSESDDAYVEELVKHVLSMWGEYEYTQGYSMCFQTQIETKDGRVLQINLLPKEEYV